MKFDPETFERKWQEKWKRDRLYVADQKSTKPTSFVVDMFPYPSGSSMHVGHPRGYVATDVYSRFKRMMGFNVLHPMGWDAFGLPAEETAIQNKEHPRKTVVRNVEKFKAQLQMLGMGYDWSREINTTDPEYYKHTQRIFLEFFKRGLARNTTVPVNWCPGLGTVLANEDIVDGKSERGSHPVFQQPMRQWILAITEYADRLVDDLELLPHWPEHIKTAQRNWIGRSEGHTFAFAVSSGTPIDVFTTRIETLPGATFIVLAPEHAQLETLISSAVNAQEVRAYIARTAERTELDRQTTKVKTGVILEGVTATHPLSGKVLPVIVADYVLASYGTGAIMAVPAHDDRDAELAQELRLPVIPVIDSDHLVNAGAYTGMSTSDARERISKEVRAVSQKKYKIRDWIFSRQRFWGEPFPIVWVLGREAYDRIANGMVKEWLPIVPISYQDGEDEYFAVPVLPQYLASMQLPNVESYEPTGTLDGPLAGIGTWVHTFINPETGEVGNVPKGAEWIAAKRETNTMPQWAGSSWYWLRYMDTKNEDEPFSKESATYWGPVNVYAGADHAVAHLLYARFWHKMMQDAGMVDFPEPFERLEFLGYILAADGSKISKRSGNSRSPEDVVHEVGADAFRMYEMFIGPFEKAIPWSDQGLIGTRRFLERVWRISERVIGKKSPQSAPAVAPSINRAVQKVGEDIEAFKFNTAVSALMICVNEIAELDISITDFKRLVAVLSPFAPHLAEELWEALGETGSIHLSEWPAVTRETELGSVTIAIQIGGKHRGTVDVPADTSEEALWQIVLNDPKFQRLLEGGEPKRFVYVPGRILSVIL